MPISQNITPLQTQIYNKITLLLDKPISQKVNKQLHDLILSQNLSSIKIKQKLLLYVMGKFRSDLILIIIQIYSTQLIVGEIKIKKFVQNLLKNIMEYENDQILAEIWAVLIKIMNKKGNINQNYDQSSLLLLYIYGYELLLKQSLKATNIQKKNKLFCLIQKNVLLFQELGLKNNQRKVIGTYIQIFNKCVLSVQNGIKIIRTLIEIVKRANQKKDKISGKSKNQEKIQVDLQTLPNFNSESLLSICSQLFLILTTTKQKPLFNLQNQCLLTLNTIFEYHSRVILQQCPIFLQNFYKYRKINQIYLYRKGTRDQARRLSLEFDKAQNLYKKINQLKMQRNYNQIDEQNQNVKNKPILIENLINKANQFLIKYKVDNININGNINTIEQNYNAMKISQNNFLKKGNGIGGGKIALQIRNNKQKNNKQQSEKYTKNTPKKDKFDILLQNCLNKCQWEKSQNNPFVKSQQMTQRPFTYQTNQFPYSPSLHTNHKKLYNFISSNKNQNLSRSDYIQGFENKKELPIFPIYDQYKMEISNSTTQCWQNDQEVNEVNQLIDLAYSYKFGLDE